MNGATYIMAVDSAGTCRIHKHTHATGVTESFSLSSVGLEVDDHNNGSILFLPDGRLVAFYGMHNDSLLRYRVSINPEDISAWSSEQARGASEGSYSYPTPYILSADPSKQWIFTRRWYQGTSGGTRTLAYRTSPDFGTVPATLSAYTDVLLEPNQRPYVRSCSNNQDEIHIAYSSSHPNEATFQTVHHAYMKLEGGIPVWRADSSVLTTPFSSASGVRIDDGGDRKRWVSDVALSAQGLPRVLWMKYPNNDGTSIEYWCSAKQDNGTWVVSKICDDGAGLYSSEQYYHGGMSFDAQDANKIYLSAPIAGQRQIQEWRTQDNGVSWSKFRDITSGAHVGLRARPMSPQNHDGQIKVVWWDGRYTTFSDYETMIMGAG